MGKGLIKFLLAGANTIDVSDKNAFLMRDILRHYHGLLVEFDPITRMAMVTRYTNDKDNGRWKKLCRKLDYKFLPEYTIMSAIYAGESETDDIETIRSDFYLSQSDFDYMVNFFKRYAYATWEKTHY